MYAHQRVFFSLILMNASMTCAGVTVCTCLNTPWFCWDVCLLKLGARLTSFSALPIIRAFFTIKHLIEMPYKTCFRIIGICLRGLEIYLIWNKREGNVSALRRERRNSRALLILMINNLSWDMRTWAELSDKLIKLKMSCSFQKDIKYLPGYKKGTLHHGFLCSTMQAFVFTVRFISVNLQVRLSLFHITMSIL